jgi:hypothetical protein
VNQEPQPRCALPDAKLVVAWDQWQRMLKRFTLAEGERLRIPFSLWQYRDLWISPSLASDHMLGLPCNFLNLGILVAEITPTWGTQRKVPRAYVKVGYLLEWVSSHRIRCDFSRWNRTNSYLRRSYKWPEPK